MEESLPSESPAGTHQETVQHEIEIEEVVEEEHIQPLEIEKPFDWRPYNFKNSVDEKSRLLPTDIPSVTEKKKRFFTWFIAQILFIVASLAFVVSTVISADTELYEGALFSLVVTASPLASELMVKLILVILEKFFFSYHCLLYVVNGVTWSLKSLMISFLISAGYLALLGKQSSHRTGLDEEKDWASVVSLNIDLIKSNPT